MKIDLGENKRARIEILPLIDIVFLLLVFFIYAMLSMAVHKGLPVQLPVSSSAEVERELPLSVTIRHNGEIMLQNRKVSLNELAEALSTVSKGRNNKGLCLFADKRVSCQLLLRVMDQIRNAGIHRISIQSKGETGP